MKQVRCPRCNKLILVGKGVAELHCKCYRCNHEFVTYLNTEE